ncbi:prosaposin-like [Bolinopsis microptera]|uniref:prosaposin-like n=1 Tax=Bolinopsis microptera TaxID=2820187 RepID=UPI003078B310
MKVITVLLCLVLSVAAGNVDPAENVLCDVCRFIGDEVTGRVLTQEAKSKVINLAKAVCSQIPVFSKECDLAVSQHGKDWVDTLFRLFDVDMLCSKAHLCTSTTMDFALRDGEACTACMDGLDMVKMIIESEDMKGLLHVVVNETCMAVAGDAASCEALVDTVLDQILGNLVPMFNVKALCVNSGACPAQLASKPTEIGCTVCQDVFGIVSNTVNSPEVEELIEITVNQTCLLVGFGVDQCEHVFLYLASSILDSVKLAVKPDYICANMGSCPVSDTFELTPVKGKEGCKACMDGMDLVDQILKSNSTIDLLHIAIDEICIAIGGDVGTCEGIIEGTLDPIINNLIAMFDPASLCKQAGSCPALENTKWEGGVFCEACVDGVLELQNIAEDTETDEMLDELTDILCNVIQIPFCNTVIGSIIKESLADVESLNPNTTCANIGACSNLDNQETVSSYEVSSSVGDTCSECTMIAGELITLLENQQVDALLKEAISEICTVLPISDCETTLDGYFDQIVALLKNMDAKTLCSLIGLC